MDIVARINQLCKEKNIDSVYELSKITGVRQSTLQHVMAGNSTRTDTIERICKGLGITMSEFFQADDLPQRAIKLSEELDLSEERKAALEIFKGMSHEEQTKRILTMYEKLKSLPLEQQKALETLINHLSTRQ